MVVTSAKHHFKITKSAAQKAMEELGGKGLRIKASFSHCGCIDYELTAENKPRKDDMVTQQHGLTVFLDRSSIPLLADAELDYVEEEEGSGFTFNNPNASHSH